MKDIGWARLESYSGDFLEKTIKTSLRKEVIKTAQNDLLVDRACKNASSCIKGIIKNFITDPISPISIIIKFKDDYVEQQY